MRDIITQLLEGCHSFTVKLATGIKLPFPVRLSTHVVKLQVCTRYFDQIEWHAMTNLQTVSIKHCDNVSGLCDALEKGGLPLLSSVAIKHWPDSFSWLRRFCQGQRLARALGQQARHLTMHYTSLHRFNMTSHFCVLESFDAKGVHMTDTEACDLCGHPTLHTLRLVDCSVQGDHSHRKSNWRKLTLGSSTGRDYHFHLMLNLPFASLHELRLKGKMTSFTNPIKRLCSHLIKPCGFASHVREVTGILCRFWMSSLFNQ